MFKFRWPLLMGCAVGLGGFVADKCLNGPQLAFVQMILCTVLVFGILGSVAGKILKRPRQAGVAVALIALHAVLITKLANYFPLPNMVIGISGAALESVTLLFLFARIGQSIDPGGPYGLTPVELERRRLLAEQLDKNFHETGK